MTPEPQWVRTQPAVVARPLSGSTRPDADADPGALRLRGLWLWISLAAAALAAAGNVAGLLWPEGIYDRETAALANAATAQDIVGLVLVAPLLVTLGVRASQGAHRAYLGWLGCLLFTVYNYAIYAFSVQFGPLFPVWVAVLGLSLFALVGGLSALDMAAVKACFADRSTAVPAWFLIVVGVLFAFLWLSEIVPELLAGRPSSSAADWRIPTNPVHVLDLAVFLPGVVTTGVLLLRRHPFGYATAAGQLVWLALTCLPILLTPFVADARGHEPGWAVTVPIGIVLVAALACLARLLRGAGGPGSGATGRSALGRRPARVHPEVPTRPPA